MTTFSYSDVINANYTDLYATYFDFSVLCHCDHVIETHGTFSFWGGYLHYQWREKGKANITSHRILQCNVLLFCFCLK